MPRKQANNKRNRSSARTNGREMRSLVRFMDAERRYLPVSYGGSVSTTPSVIALNSCAEGDDNGQREGKRIYMESMKLNVDVTNADSPANIVRVIVYIDRNTNSSTLANPAPYLLSDPSSYPWISPINPQYTSLRRAREGRRFVVLADHIFNPGATWQPVQRRSFNIPLRMESGYVNTTDEVPQTNGLFVLLVSDSSVTTHPAYLISSLLTYTP